MLREIIEIDEDKCDGCGECIPNCAEGALQLIDGKARLISDLFCDGLGACVGHCPQSAITIVKREAEPYDEPKVMETIVKGGANTIIAHLRHLKEHNETGYLNQALNFLKEKEIYLEWEEKPQPAQHHGCPGSRTMVFDAPVKTENDESGKRVSHLTQWPVQLHLVSPSASYFHCSELLLAADCVGFSYPDFHKDFLKGKSLAIACPKLDTNKQVYVDKLVRMITESKVKSITVLVMQVPCCSGLVHLAQEAVNIAGSDIPVKAVVIGIQGEILNEFSVN